MNSCNWVGGIAFHRWPRAMEKAAGPAKYRSMAAGLSRAAAADTAAFTADTAACVAWPDATGAAMNRPRIFDCDDPARDKVACRIAQDADGHDQPVTGEGCRFADDKRGIGLIRAWPIVGRPDPASGLDLEFEAGRSTERLPERKRRRQAVRSADGQSGNAARPQPSGGVVQRGDKFVLPSCRRGECATGPPENALASISSAVSSTSFRSDRT